MINFDYSYTKNFITENEIKNYASQIKEIHNGIHNKTCLGNEYLGWLDLAENYSEKDLNKIKSTAKKIQNNSDVFIVIGIGGSYLGSKMVIDALNPTFFNNIKRPRKTVPEIIFLGTSLSSNYLVKVLEYIKDKNVSVNVISKSGNTLEIAIAFNFIKNFMEQKYKEETKNRIFITTENSKNTLKNLADRENYETFEIPKDVGGRFSVLTPAGLLPIAVAGIDIDAILQGAEDSSLKYNQPNMLKNDCYKYAVIRNILYKKEKVIEILATYEPNLHYFGEWWKQLFGESEGKSQGGVFPATTTFTTDLHSLGQYIQEGKRNIFETTLFFKQPENDLMINNIDNINYLNDKSLHYINTQAFKGTVLAHTQGGVPNLILTTEKLNAYNLGYLIYFFEKACAISCLLNNINPFNQPGVELYKQNIKKLLN